ncbi:hypothetical protein E4T38_01735 [Aureobasidium subglaciale]|nr:hypothetical protein E4T38_01735 [Aureobasidium subglaciale]KAI5222544.1 hypothetical protein E4T40_04952 [Aureobasidium subglaciale]KAI5233210.1 hypothetical protein E4T41_01733 [Aureobasidium subglaciale]KAI5262256.1 hypothetical protein E4T46_04664 [Aureobasidium subglaciale]
MSVEDEAVTTSVRLPPDVWQLLFDELASRNDFSSLYNCAVASKHLAGSGALANLYRNFFSGSLARFNITSQTRGKNRALRSSNMRETVAAIGDAIVKAAPMLEELTEPIVGEYNILSSALPRWAPDLSRLRSLELWDGKTLGDETVQNLLHKHCPYLNRINIYQWRDDESDVLLARFLNNMPKNTLQYFENIGECGIGIETCRALNTHAESLRFLALAIPDKGIEGLGLMKNCTVIETLKLTDTQPPHDLKEMQKDTLHGMIEWLKQCTKLREVNLTDFISAPDILTPALSEEGVDLEDLQINARRDDCMYALREHSEFHAAIGLQTKLQSLVLKADPDPLEPVARNQLCESLCELRDLRYLQLTRSSDYFQDDQLQLLGENLLNLEDLNVSGWLLSDSTLATLSNLGNLKSLTFNGLSVFTADGLLEFIDKLGPSNRGLAISIDMASLDAALSGEEQDLVRDTLATKVQGRFEYQLVRDPDVPEFDEGLEADQKVIAAHGCYAMTATTALTAQNTQGVTGIHETPSEFVKKCIDACAEDVGIDVVKTGMLASAGTIQVVADALRKYKPACSIVDPVMVATSGARLLKEEAIKTLCTELLPVTGLITPNIPEALLLLEESGNKIDDIKDLDGMKRLAKAVADLGPKSVLIKGGHIPLKKNYEVATTDDEKEVLVNVLYTDGDYCVFESKYQIARNTHGTGCSLASAIACNVANGLSMERAVRAAGRYVEAGIKTSVDLGKGSGPINHFHSLNIMPFPPGGFVDWLLEREDVQRVWRDFTQHDFVEKMGDGTLPVERFKFYMVQDYLYLTQFARANALAGYKAKTLEGVAASASIVTHIHTETKLHVSECLKLGVTMDELRNSEEHQACTAYSRYILDIGASEDWLALQIAMFPCLIGYHHIAKRLSALQDPSAPKNANRYRQWIDNYIADDYTQAVGKGMGGLTRGNYETSEMTDMCAELVEGNVFRQSPSRIEELVKIFIHATKMECGFWDMGMGA